MIVGIIVGIVAVAVIVGFVFVNQPSFGREKKKKQTKKGAGKTNSRVSGVLLKENGWR